MKDSFQFEKNSHTNKWVIIAPDRDRRPNMDSGTEPVCPFCPGNESHTPPEVFRSGNGTKDKPGWQIRVVPNKYPFAPVHEVVIDSPSHDNTFFDHAPIYISRLFRIYKDRFNLWKTKGNVVIFYNFGTEAAASLPHPHAQITVVPKEIQMDANPTVKPENIVHQSRHFSVFIPNASAWPYEIWFLPKKRGHLFGDISQEELSDIGDLLSRVLVKLEDILGKKFPFNFHIYHGGDWYLRLIPRLRKLGGFEIASGIYVHSTSPKEAAAKLKW